MFSSLKAYLYVGLSLLVGGVLWYYILFVPNKLQTLKTAITVDNAKEETKEAIFKAVVDKDKKAVNEKLKFKYSTYCESNCTHSL